MTRRAGRFAGAALGLGAVLAAGAARAEGPMYYLETFGPTGDAIADLTWGLIALAVTVVLIISVLVLFSSLARRDVGPWGGGRRLPVSRGEAGLSWIYLGLALTTVALAGSVTWTVVTMAAIGHPPEEPRVTIEVTGHQWWWEVTYLSDDPSRRFETAKRDPHSGRRAGPLQARLGRRDPLLLGATLSGKTDLIPGQTNTTWLQADEPGVYRGQCAEYCGRQHAHMVLRVFADPPEQFQAWWDQQLEAAEPPETDIAEAGLTQFILRCGACHTVRSTRSIDGRRRPPPGEPLHRGIGPGRATRHLVALWPLGVGVLILAALWLGPLPAMSRRAFSPHMMLHLGVAVVAAPMIAIGLNRARLGLTGLPRPLLAALAASAVEMAVVWGWHFPALHEAAALNDAAFVAQQVSFLAAGMAIWMVSFSGTSRASSGVGMLAMLFTCMHMAMLGVLLALAPDILYAPELCLGAFGLDRLEDQRFGGALMAVWGGLPYLLGGVVLAYRFISD